MGPVAELEYKVLTQNQKERHGDPHSREVVQTTSRYLRPDSEPKTLWVTHNFSECQLHEQGDMITFTLNGQGHLLVDSVYFQKIPAIKVRKEYAKQYRIAWPRYVGHHLIRTGELVDGGVIRQSITDTYIDFYAQLFVNRDEGYMYDVGNIPKLTEWSDSLPAFTTQCHHPWFYALKDANNIPIDLEHEDGNITHVYNVRREVKSLIRMQKWNEAQKVWYDISPRMRYLEGIPPNGKMELPHLWVTLASFSRGLNRDQYFSSQGKIEYCDISIEHVSTPCNPNTEIKFDIVSRFPSEALLIGASRYRDDGVDYLSNYSTSIDDDAHMLDIGKNPIQSASVEYLNIKRDGMAIPEHILTGAIPRRRFPYRPTEPGYNVYALAGYPNSPIYDRETGIPFGGDDLHTRLTIRLSGRERSYYFEAEVDSSDDEEIKDKEVSDALEALNRETKEKPTASKAPRSQTPERYSLFVMSLIQRDIQYVFNPEKGKYAVLSSRDRSALMPSTPVPFTPRFSAI